MKKAFTVVEVFIVLTILALLMTMMAPAFQKVKREAEARHKVEQAARDTNPVKD